MNLNYQIPVKKVLIVLSPIALLVLLLYFGTYRGVCEFSPKYFHFRIRTVTFLLGIKVYESIEVMDESVSIYLKKKGLLDSVRKDKWYKAFGPFPPDSVKSRLGDFLFFNVLNTDVNLKKMHTWIQKDNQRADLILKSLLAAIDEGNEALILKVWALREKSLNDVKEGLSKLI